MNWISEVVRPRIKTLFKRETPENLWIKDPETGEMVFHKDLEENQFVIPSSGYHMKIAAKERLKFFFDEAWCDPEEELGRLRSAQLARQPLPFVTGAGTFTGARYVVESIDSDIKRTTLAGRTVRLEASLTLTESPIEDLAGFATILQRGLAAGINVQVRK